MLYIIKYYIPIFSTASVMFFFIIEAFKFLKHVFPTICRLCKLNIHDPPLASEAN